MTQPETANHEEWVAARNDLLEREEELNRLGNELAEQRRALPWVRVDLDPKGRGEAFRAVRHDEYEEAT